MHAKMTKSLATVLLVDDNAIKIYPCEEGPLLELHAYTPFFHKGYNSVLKSC